LVIRRHGALLLVLVVVLVMGVLLIGRVMGLLLVVRVKRL